MDGKNRTGVLDQKGERHALHNTGQSEFDVHDHRVELEHSRRQAHLNQSIKKSDLCPVLLVRPPWVRIRLGSLPLSWFVRKRRYPPSAAWAAASFAIGTRKGLQLT